MMTIDEAIKHSREKANALRCDGKYVCAAEYEQLAEWLEELKRRRED